MKREYDGKDIRNGAEVVEKVGGGWGGVGEGGGGVGVFFFNDTATTEIYTLSLHDALPISCAIGQDRLSEISHGSYILSNSIHAGKFAGGA